MTSVLKVDNIQNSSGTSAMTIDSSGVITDSQKPLFYAHDITNSSGASGWKVINWTTIAESHKIDWDATNYRIKPTVAGYYHIVFNHGHNNGNHSDYYVTINHSNYGRISNANADAGQRLSISAIEYFDGTNDYITTEVYHSNTSHSDENISGERRCNVGMFLVKGD